MVRLTTLTFEDSHFRLCTRATYLSDSHRASCIDTAYESPIDRAFIFDYATFRQPSIRHMKALSMCGVRPGNGASPSGSRSQMSLALPGPMPLSAVSA
eukprot:3412170-Prymnesium_polylepis.1